MNQKFWYWHNNRHRFTYILYVICFSEKNIKHILFTEFCLHFVCLLMFIYYCLLICLVILNTISDGSLSPFIHVVKQIQMFFSSPMRMQGLQQTWKISTTILYIRFHIRYEDKIRELTVREKADPHQNFSRSLQNLNCLKRKKKSFIAIKRSP